MAHKMSAEMQPGDSMSWVIMETNDPKEMIPGDQGIVVKISIPEEVVECDPKAKLGRFPCGGTLDGPIGEIPGDGPIGEGDGAGQMRKQVGGKRNLLSKEEAE